MTGVECFLSDEAKDSITSFMSDDTSHQALILKCMTKGRWISVDQLVSPANPEELAHDLPTSSPRFILYRYGINLDDAYTQPILLLVFFNPIDVAVDIKRTYQKSKPNLLSAIVGYKEIEVCDVENFTTDWFSNRVIGIRGKKLPS